MFLTFAKVGVMTFGGGYAMLPILQREVVEKKGWATEEELMDYFAIGQCTPGIIAVNTATFVGHKVKGVAGGIAATLGVISPSLVIITVIAMVLENFMDIVWVQHAFAGIRVAVCALITASVVKLFKSNVKKNWHIVLAVIAFVWVALLKLSPVYVVVGCAVLSFIFGKKEAAK
jgi:chromate transporter